MSDSDKYKYGGYNEVVSEVNTFLSPAASIKPLCSDKNRVAKLAFSIPKRSESIEKQSAKTQVKVDNDGDLVLPRKTENADLEELHLLIEYENSTSIEKVGLQVWRGAFLLADFLIHNQIKYAKDKRVLEVGSGTGLTAIVAAMYANLVTATDINDPTILKLLETNATGHNKKLINCGFEVKPLDFLDSNWSPELAERVNEADVILAADVVYHNDITTAFVHTLKKIVTSGTKSKDIFIAMEKRYIFTMDDLDSVSPMYAHFMDELDRILQVYPGCLEKSVKGDNGSTFNTTIQFVPNDYPQYFTYERTPQLILLHLKSSVN
ncbi:unnamed protein product [Orchesella dallaii]|uniref:Methyltransferase-like protein 22 n=1 Tax=Orchesella dallaii TaxID=48710 RepID=A0ABP1PJZ8_9HEXA